MKREQPDLQQEFHWKAYYEALEGREPRPLLTEALARFHVKSDRAFQLHAVDLGCGDGTETIALLEGGWQVLAVDREPAAITNVRSKARIELQSHLESRVASFENMDLPETDLVYAGFSLPFCKPERFDRLWATITACIRPGGRFAGQLFGFRDS